jgi:hypothetical protein
VSGGNQPAEGGAAIGYGWRKFTQHWGEIVIALIVGFVALVLLSIVGILLRAGIGTDGVFPTLLGGGLSQLLTFLGQSVLALFIIRATLMIVRGQPLDASRIMSAENLGNYIIGAIIVGVLTFVGIILCVIPGILVWFFTLFWGYFVVDKDMAPMDAITASYNLVKDNAGAVVVFALLSILVMIAGAIVCGVGLIVAIPVVIIASGYMYMRLQGEPVAA